ncbi:MAG: peptidoglycan editing factor PgeF [Chloroflexota bacterium]|nr:peptidoglycan editing factor PgeF [Chloroflexota bacterium]
MTSNTADPTTLLRPARSALLDSIDGIAHGVSHRVEGLGEADGNIGLGSPRNKVDAWRMRQLWAEAIGVDAETIVTGGQIHEATILRAEAEDAGRGSRDGIPHLGIGDGLMTDAPDVTLLTLHADCQPILVVDPRRPAIAAVHAGWRGTVKNIAGAVVDAMHRTYGSQPEDLLVYLGPALAGCCAEMGPEVTTLWRETATRLDIDPEAALSKPGEREHFDVPEANRSLLLAAGVRAEHIDVSPECTRCDTERWFSHRGHGPGAGREGAFIAIRSQVARVSPKKDCPHT